VAKVGILIDAGSAIARESEPKTGAKWEFWKNHSANSVARMGKSGKFPNSRQKGFIAAFKQPSA